MEIWNCREKVRNRKVIEDKETKRAMNKAKGQSGLTV